MEIKIFQVDTFTSILFRGNPAAVCPLPEWLPDELMQAVAAENNLSETAFFVDRPGLIELRWFTPTTEIDLCGHATLATAFVLFHCLGYQGDRLRFLSPRSGELTVIRQDRLLQMNLPAIVPSQCGAPLPLYEAFGGSPERMLAADDYLVVFRSEAEITGLKPSMLLLEALDKRGVIVTAPGDEVDFVSRFFAPKVGIPEDPVTGSAHCSLVPYWSKRLGKKKLVARQISARGGELFCEDRGERILLSGECVLYLEGTITIR